MWKFLNPKKEDKKTYLNREFNTFKKNIGKEKFIFNALNEKKQFMLFLDWKRYKYQNKLKNIPISKKGFFIEILKNKRYTVNKKALRESVLNILINE